MHLKTGESAGEQVGASCGKSLEVGSNKGVEGLSLPTDSLIHSSCSAQRRYDVSMSSFYMKIRGLDHNTCFVNGVQLVFLYHKIYFQSFPVIFSWSCGHH